MSMLRSAVLPQQLDLILLWLMAPTTAVRTLTAKPEKAITVVVELSILYEAF